MGKELADLNFERIRYFVIFLPYLWFLVCSHSSNGESGNLGRHLPQTNDIAAGSREPPTGDKQSASSTTPYPLTPPKAKRRGAGPTAAVVLLISQWLFNRLSSN